MFAVLADPTRVRVVEALAERERTVNEIVALFEVSQPTISRHLRVLRDAGLAVVTADGPRRVYRLDPRPLRDLDRWLGSYRKLWAQRLDGLDRYLDATEGR